MHTQTPYPSLSSTWATLQKIRSIIIHEKPVFALLLIIFLFTILAKIVRDNRFIPISYNESNQCYVKPNNDEARNGFYASTRTSQGSFKKINLWDLMSGPHLRGANIMQRRVYPELDGTIFIGSGPVGPPYTQEDFNRLAAMGANYVNISHPGLFTETPPYNLDKKIQGNLDILLDMIAKADMFAVITFRTGPGRNEFAIHPGEAGSWYPKSMLVNTVWQNQESQNAWIKMWQHTAQRYWNNPIVVGYDLMCEPNSNDYLDEWEPEHFYQKYENTLHDWNHMYPPIVAAIREVDSSTPILTGGMGYSAVEWLPYLQPIRDSHMVYIVHQYAPYLYTHQWWNNLKFTYPGVFDTDWDNVDDHFNQVWLNDLLSAVDIFSDRHEIPVAVNEFGVMRWVPGAASFMDDQMNLFEQRGMNYALWMWDSSWKPYTSQVDSFNFRHGPNPNNHSDVASSKLIEVIYKYWNRNTLRPSNAITKKIIIRK